MLRGRLILELELVVVVEASSSRKNLLSGNKWVESLKADSDGEVVVSVLEVPERPILARSIGRLGLSPKDIMSISLQRSAASFELRRETGRERMVARV